MVTIQKKKEIVSELVEKFNKADGYYFVDFAGLNVEKTIALRREFKKEGFEFKVAKNTLFIKALNEIGNNVVPDDKFVGATAVVFGYGDPVKPAKIIKEQVDKTQNPKLKAAVLEGVFYDGSRLKELSELPSKPDMIASIIGSIHAPITGIVGSINAVMRDLASLVEEVAKKQGK
jgi:large subunit ribosomal protein L10